MSSSCVPPKEPCVMHDPNPGGVDNGNDTDSECGSLCTCTSSSMTSIATSVATCHHHNGRISRLGGSSASLSQPLTPQANQLQGSNNNTNSSTGSSQDQNSSDPNGNPYIVVFVPPTMLSNRNSNCGNCRGQGAVHTACRAYFLTACEFCPWVAGFVFIYYAFYWWGIGPGFSAFLFMMGSHALIRFLRARGEAYCGIAKLSRVSQNNTNTETEENDGEEEDEDGEAGEEESADAPPDVVNESPPSYEVAVVKPPPYDLFYHLTPTQPRNQTLLHVNKSNLSNNFLTVPSDIKQGKQMSEGDDGDDDVFLPSYQDAIRLSFRSEKSFDDIDEITFEDAEENHDQSDVFSEEKTEEES